MTKRFRKILPNFLSMSPDRIISCLNFHIQPVKLLPPHITLVQCRLGNETFFIVTVAVEWHHQHVYMYGWWQRHKRRNFLAF